MGISIRAVLSFIAVASLVSMTTCSLGPLGSDGTTVKDDIALEAGMISLLSNRPDLGDELITTSQGSRADSDPGFRHGTLLGGPTGGDDSIVSIQVDGAGNVFVAGWTGASNFPVSNGAYDETMNGSDDLFIAKLDPSLSNLLYCTFLGGSDSDRLSQIHLNQDGSLYVTGTTNSADFPTTTGAYCETSAGGRDGFLVKLNAQGSDLEYATLFGGSDDDWASGLAIDGQGRVCITGSTRSEDLPVTLGANRTSLSGSSDAYALRFNNELTGIDMCTYIGSPGSDSGSTLVLRPDGSFVMSGVTDGVFPTTPGAYCSTYINDGQFVLQLDPTGSTIDFATISPNGRGRDDLLDLTVDPWGNIILVGFSNSSDFPTTTDAISRTVNGGADIFVSILKDDASALTYSTFFGGSGFDSCMAIDLDISGERIAITGLTTSPDLPVTEAAFDIEYREKFDSNDAYMCVFNITNKSIDYMTYIGGENRDSVYPVRFGPNGHVYVGGDTNSKDFYTSPDALQTIRLSGQEGFVYEINPIPGHIPSAPNGLAASTTIDQVFLNWDKPDRDGGCRILGYNVYRADASTNWTLMQFHANRTFDDWDVENGITYRYRVAAVNNLGEGAFADLTTSIPVVPPSEPLDLTASSGNGSVTINWTSPVELGGGKIRAYLVYRSPTRNELEVLGEVGNVTSFVDDTATLGEFYYYAVAGMNSGGEGPMSATVRIKPVGPPGAPSNFNAVGNDGQVTLTWAAPGTNGGSMLIGFYIYRGTSLDNVTRIATMIVTQRSLEDSDVVNGVRYVYYLTAFTEVGESGPTKTIDVTPFGLPGRVMDLQAIADDGQVILEWSPPASDGGQPITKYKIYAGEGSAGSMVYLTQIGNITMFDHSGLTNGITYYYQVTAINKAGEGLVSGTISANPMGLPASVQDFTAAAIKDGIRLTWRLPDDLGGAESVKVWLVRGDPDAPQFEDAVIGAVEYLDINVTPGTTYEYWARTETIFGMGPLVGPVEVTAVTVPGAVRELETAYGDGEVRLTWSAPEEDGGSPVVEYIIKRGIFVTGMLVVARVTVLTHTDTGLDNGKEYLYVVVAVNAVGAGAETEPVRGTPLGPPGAPGLFKAEAKKGKVVLTWATPIGSDRASVTGFKILRATGDGELEVIAELGEVTSYTDQNVKAGKSYNYRIYALSDIGEGNAPAKAEVKINKADEGPGFTSAIIILAFTIMIALLSVSRIKIS